MTRETLFDRGSRPLCRQDSIMTAVVNNPPRNGGLIEELKDRIAGKLFSWWKL